MKKYIGLLICMAFILCLNGCEQDGSEGSYAETVAGFAQMLAGMASDTDSYNGEATSQSQSMSAMGDSQRQIAVTNSTSTWMADVSTTTGKVTIVVAWSIWSEAGSISAHRIIEFVFKDDEGDPIIANNIIELYIAAVIAKSLEWSDDYTGPFGGTYSVDLVFMRDVAGQPSGTVSGTASGTGPAGGVYAATLTELEGSGDGSGILTGGSLTASFTSPGGKEWAVLLTYNDDGSADGTISGPDYSGTIHLNANRTGSYTDDDDSEEHNLPAPASATQS
jgi:hypothetical protein